MSYKFADSLRAGANAPARKLSAVIMIVCVLRGDRIQSVEGRSGCMLFCVEKFDYEDKTVL